MSKLAVNREACPHIFGQEVGGDVNHGGPRLAVVVDAGRYIEENITADFVTFPILHGSEVVATAEEKDGGYNYFTVDQILASWLEKDIGYNFTVGVTVAMVGEKDSGFNYFTVVEILATAVEKDSG